MISDIIPIKSSDISITPFDNGGFLIYHKILEYRINVNESIIHLLNLVDGKSSIEMIHRAYTNQFKKEISLDDIHEIFYTKLGKYHIIKNNNHEYKAIEKPDYLKLSFIILKKEWIESITSSISTLFSKKIFYPVLITSFILICLIGYSNYNEIEHIFDKLNHFHLTFIFIISITTVFFHELGHAAACKYFGANHGGIGFGFYLLSPVMYADVSDIWKLKRKERIIVNLAGLYIQILIALFFGVIFLITNQLFFLTIMYMLGLISVFVNINPFFRTDGYWVLSDLSGVSNLRKTSNEKLSDLFFFFTKKKKVDLNRTNILLAFYALISTSFIFIFIFTILLNDTLSIFSFPFDVYSFISNTINGQQNFSATTLKKLMLPLLFYILVIKLLKSVYKKRIKKLELTTKKKMLSIVFSNILAITYLLSAGGKTLGFSSFVRKVEEYPIYIENLPLLIIGIEYILALGFISLLWSNFFSKISILFLVLITLIYSYGFFILKITACDCFGSISILNSNNFYFTLLKNVILTSLSFFIYQNTINIRKHHLLKSLISFILVFFMSFQVFNYDRRASKNYTLKHIGASINKTEINIPNEIKKHNNWFVFSPTCEHCKNAIHHINRLSKKMDVVGITSMKNKEKVTTLNNEIKLMFLIKYIKGDDLVKLTKTVPQLFIIKNDTIQNVFIPNKKKIDSLIGE